MKHLWNENLEAPIFPSLTRDMTTDVLIIGGGIAGVLCAYYLEQMGVQYCLVEGGRIGEGVTARTTAVITAQHDTLYQDLIKRFGDEKTKQYLDANLDALRSYKNLAKKIDCDFEIMPSMMYETEDTDKMKKEVEALRKLGFEAQYRTQIPLPIQITGAVEYPGMAQFHPLKFLYGIAKGLRIFENTFVTELRGHEAHTSHGTITAKKIIIATHYPFINTHGLYPAKLYQQKSYVIAVKSAMSLDATLEDVKEDGMYFRNYQDLLLIGGGQHRTGTKSEGYTPLRNFVAQHFKNATEVYAWTNQDCVSLDGVPYIGPYSPSMKDVYVASGFNLWGMTTSFVAAKILVGEVLQEPSRYAPVFAPNRSLFTKQLAKNIGATCVDFLLPTTRRCSHLGCALKWDAREHCWECACHGSRFDEDGKVLNNPAMKNIQIKK